VQGSSFGRYWLQGVLGRGGMGEVWRAYDTATNRIVAIKLLPPQLAADQTFVRRFRREAAAGATTQTVLPFTGLNYPEAVAVDGAGSLYVTDWGNSRVLKRKQTAQTTLC
jgi:hypothetical protein